MLGKAYRNSIGFRFFSIITLAMLIGTVLLSAVVSYYDYQSSRRRLTENGQNLALFIARLSKEPLIAQDTVTLDAIVHDAHNKEIVYALIYDTSNKLMTSQYASLNYRLPRFNAVFATFPKDADLPEIISFLRKEGHITDVSLPIVVETTPIGRIVLGMSDHVIRSQIKKTIISVVSINAVMAALLCTALIMLSRKTVFDPLTALAESNLKLAQGDLTARVNIVAKGELKLLVDSFNHMAASLDENEKQLRAIFDTSKAGIIMVNDQACIVLANQSMSDMFGYSQNELISSSYLRLVSPSDEESGDFNLNGLISGKIDHVSRERHYLRKDGTKFIGYVSARRHNDSEGNLISIVCIISDITDQKRIEADRLELERQLLHSQKLESLGVLAGGIAHDFNNLLAVILGNLDLVLLRLPKPSPFAVGIERSMQACRKAADLTKQMLAYSGKGIVQLKRMNLNQIVRENIELLTTTVPKTITFTVKLDENLPKVTVDPGQIQQVVMNLITNAAEAIGEKPGTITLSTGVKECTAEFMLQSRLEEKQPGGRYAYIEVSDSGSGMDAETEQRIFEPFYSTKFTGRGLGMSAVLGIIKAHNGAIILDNEPERGSLFKVLLPMSDNDAIDDKADELQKPEQSATRSSFTGLVLVVDDEPNVLDFCVQCVDHFGFTPLSAVDGLEAIKIFRKHANEIRLVILDMTMPKMDGIATFKELKRINPAVRVIISTGHSAQNTTMSFTGDKPDAFIQKPFHAQELQEKIQQVIQ